MSNFPGARFCNKPSATSTATKAPTHRASPDGAEGLGGVDHHGGDDDCRLDGPPDSLPPRDTGARCGLEVPEFDDLTPDAKPGEPPHIRLSAGAPPNKPPHRCAHDHRHKSPRYQPIRRGRERLTSNPRLARRARTSPCPTTNTRLTTTEECAAPAARRRSTLATSWVPARGPRQSTLRGSRRSSMGPARSYDKLGSKASMAARRSDSAHTSSGVSARKMADCRVERDKQLDANPAEACADTPASPDPHPNSPLCAPPPIVVDGEAHNLAKANRTLVQGRVRGG